MDFSDASIGQHCSLPLCSQKDFLPFQCQFCSKVFCTDHRRPQDHQCTKAALNAEDDDNYVMLCPLCGAALRLKGMAA